MQRAYDFLQGNLSHTGCRTTQSFTPHQRPRGRIIPRIRLCHVPIKDILITQAVGQPTDSCCTIGGTCESGHPGKCRIYSVGSAGFAIFMLRLLILRRNGASAMTAHADEIWY